MKKLPRIISQEEFEKIFQAEKNKKFRLAYLLGFEAGMRIGEVIGYKGKSRRKNKKTGEIIEKDIEIPPLNKENIDLNAHFIRILGKGSKERIVPLPKRFTQKAKDMLPLLLPRRTLQDAIRRVCKRVLGKNLSFHTLRHGFGSLLAEKGRPLHEIQMLMGHSRLDTTGIYLHANPKEAVEKAIEVF